MILYDSGVYILVQLISFVLHTNVWFVRLFLVKENSRKITFSNRIYKSVGEVLMDIEE